ncbi:hypothetical protein ElyMa_003083900 [Elysia marginata]|uniref:Prohibitin n=1 Tax=Elysia marginata TaxID=1093978 RepID=A0AAV4ILH3_9GAST|nr:hypothetical protein ElyMa_003083900 [Elysia marginata]
MGFLPFASIQNFNVLVDFSKGENLEFRISEAKRQKSRVIDAREIAVIELEADIEADNRATAEFVANTSVQEVLHNELVLRKLSAQ